MTRATEHPRVILVAGSTRTAEIDGISAAGASRDARLHTPGADAELLTYGEVVRAPAVPVSPNGCPTPALVTRTVRERVGFDVTVIDGGLARPTGAPTVTVGARPGNDIREPDPVQTAPGAFTAARELGRGLPDERIVVGETIPGGTTTAMAVLKALGEARIDPSSSLPENPIDLKRRVVREAFEASSFEPGQAAHNPEQAVRFVGDPVLAVAAGLVAGALESGTEVVLGGGTQLLAVAALVRHAGVPRRATLATTRYLADDVSGLREAAAAFDLDLVVSDPGFDADDAGPLAAFADGVAKEGAVMGGALRLADEADRLDEVTDATLGLLDRVVAGGDESKGRRARDDYDVKGDRGEGDDSGHSNDRRGGPGGDGGVDRGP
ncbi:MAG: nicotinate-nucleotide--dimethylbenzimidazole phosphoribosyltransferase [Halobellus sp.]|uniref:nicotinate-nucleotide--dimethylbenzimidazole phosphoribosyltransferase n=1 Tax=Halobellus sp. TaxID=1979212 RepID=UPI0035D46C64